MSGEKLYSRKDLIYFTLLAVTVGSYALYLFSFTLFEGLSTFSNDSGGYVLLAKKWSPYFLPSVAELKTWPFHVYPLGFSWALAFTGLSKTLYLSHLFVSTCMLLSIWLIGWFSCRSFGWLAGGALSLGLCWLPGNMFSSLGILSENFYLLLSLGVLGIYLSIRERENPSWAWFAILLALLTLTILTRSIGIALAMAIIMVATTDRSLGKTNRVSLVVIGLLSVALWQLWGLFKPQSDNVSYFDVIGRYVSSNESNVVTLFSQTLAVAMNNIIEMLNSWNELVIFNQDNSLSLIFSLTLAFACLLGLGIRLKQNKVDAIYLAIYLAIIAVWPYPEEMTRFLHPVIFLLILQPALYLSQAPMRAHINWVKAVIIFFGIILFVHSLIVGKHFWELRKEARTNNPAIAHSYEYYATPVTEIGTHYAVAYADVMKHMRMSAELLPDNSIIASAKHESYAVLTGLESVNFVSTVSYPQQLCNLIVRNVDALFFSNLTTALNPHGNGLLENYRSIASQVLTIGPTEGRDEAYLLIIDKDLLYSALSELDFDCQQFRELENKL